MLEPLHKFNTHLSTFGLGVIYRLEVCNDISRWDNTSAAYQGMTMKILHSFCCLNTSFLYVFFSECVLYIFMNVFLITISMFYECFLQTLMSARQDSLDVLRDVRISTDRTSAHVLQTMCSQQINTHVYVSISCIGINLCMYISICNCLHKFTLYMLAFVCSIHDIL